MKVFPLVSWCIFSACLSVLTGCSVTYNNFLADDSGIPEFQLEQAVIMRYENANPTVQLSAGMLELYKDDETIYGADVSFNIHDGDELTTRGSCGLFAANTNTKLYLLFNGIDVESTRDSVQIHAEELKWSGDSGVVASGTASPVSITRIRNPASGGDHSSFSLTGTGFSANTKVRSYRFTGTVTGTIVTGDEKGSPETILQEAMGIPEGGTE